MGKVYPGASYASASAALTQNILPVLPDESTPDKNFNGIFVRAHPSNSAPIYICNSAAAPDVVTYLNVVDVLAPGALFNRSKEWANNRDISKLYVGAANSTDFAVVSIDQF